MATRLPYLTFLAFSAHAKNIAIDTLMDAVDPGIKLFVRSKKVEGQT